MLEGRGPKAPFYVRKEGERRRKEKKRKKEREEIVVRWRLLYNTLVELSSS
jgi:hypothetical protein